MRLLVFSDVHANATALEAALVACAGHWEKAVCLGDIVGYGPDPNEVVGRVRSLASAVVRGNHDKAVGGAADLEDFNPAAHGMKVEVISGAHGVSAGSGVTSLDDVAGALWPEAFVATRDSV